MLKVWKVLSSFLTIWYTFLAPICIQFSKLLLTMPSCPKPTMKILSLFSIRWLPPLQYRTFLRIEQDQKKKKKAYCPVTHDPSMEPVYTLVYCLPSLRLTPRFERLGRPVNRCRFIDPPRRVFRRLERSNGRKAVQFTCDDWQRDWRKGVAIIKNGKRTAKVRRLWRGLWFYKFGLQKDEISSTHQIVIR